MNRRTFSSFRNWALAGVAIAAIASPARAEEARQFQIPSQSLVAALEAFGKQGDAEIIFNRAQVEGHSAASISGSYEPAQALAMLLDGSGLKFRQVNGNTFMVEASDPQSGSAAGDGADGTVAALIVTAQKREEDIQDVPIAISAFTQTALEEQKIEGGFDLLKAIPNVTFSKNNFTSYNFSIRGIGTKAVSATTDPGVAVAFNSTALIVNRLFEQEYFDIERVEVLRGPQGTLYGRNATAGVINVISAKPDLNEFSGWVKGEVGNYDTKRLSAMINVPLAEDKLAIRLAGAMTTRDGYDFNAGTGNPVNGRDLWSARLTVGFQPTERIRANLIWERFEEDDDRSRTGKQLCHRDPGPKQVGDFVLPTPEQDEFDGVMTPALFSQGCKPGSLYDDAAFGTPNGLALPFVFGLLGLGHGQGAFFPLGITSEGEPVTLLQLQDPYGGMMQSRDLRMIQSFRDPRYRAKADIFEMNLDIDLGDSFTLTSQTAYSDDEVYSFQDFNRFNTVPIFTDTSNLTNVSRRGSSIVPSAYSNLAPNGVFCDPQLGCSDTMAGFDISQGSATQFSQEIRLQSEIEGPINFSLGANYTRFSTLIDYYVMYNLITALTTTSPFQAWNDFVPPHVAPDVNTLLTSCTLSLQPPFAIYPPFPQDDQASTCVYVDPNPVESINGEGHNYFRSKNPYRLKSYAAFGELYWQATDAFKVTAGLRYTKDRKTFTPVPSQVLLASNPFLGGDVGRGYPSLSDIKQSWGEFSGRLAVDWRPEVSFTDQTMVYGSYSRGYKGGGANPPSPGFSTRTFAEAAGIPPGTFPLLDFPALSLNGVEYGPTFEPEFVDAFEVGAKNTLLGGSLVFNADAFFYNYDDYQVSQIRDRTAVNENFDARVWGLEFETLWHPSRNLRINANLGYLDTRIGDGEKSIDIMNRTQGDPDWTLVKPWFQLPSNCIVPTAVAERYLEIQNGEIRTYYGLCGGVHLFFLGVGEQVVDPATGEVYTPDTYPESNGGAGIADDLSGNELPNSPHWTANLGVQQSWDFLEGWRATVRGDAYWQSQSWARVYNSDPYDKLHGWYNVNLSVWFEKPDDDLKIELYAKNLLDKTPITDAFLNSDDTALTTNVFVLDPRLIGLSIKKGF